MPSAPAAGASWVADRVLASNQELGAYRLLSPLRAVVDTAGTVAYLAPERFEGKPATVQSGLYALGLVLDEARTCAIRGRWIC